MKQRQAMWYLSLSPLSQSPRFWLGQTANRSPLQKSRHGPTITPTCPPRYGAAIPGEVPRKPCGVDRRVGKRFKIGDTNFSRGLYTDFIHLLICRASEL